MLGAVLWARPRLEEEMLLQELEGSLSLEYANCAASDPTLARAEFCQLAWTQTVQESELPESAKARLNALALERASLAMTLAALEACFDSDPQSNAACAQRWVRSVESSRLSEPDKADLLARFERRSLSAALEARLNECHGLGEADAKACVSDWVAALSQSGLTPQESSAAASRALRRLQAEEEALAASSPKAAPSEASGERPDPRERSRANPSERFELPRSRQAGSVSI